MTDDETLESLRMRYAVVIGRPEGRGVWATAMWQTTGTSTSPEMWEVSVGGPWTPFALLDVGVTMADALRGLAGYVEAVERNGEYVREWPCRFGHPCYTVCERCGKTRDLRGGNGPCGGVSTTNQ